MTNKQITSKSIEILNRCDIEQNGLISRKQSSKHDDELEVLLEHISLLITDLKFQLTATLHELSEAQNILEE